MVSSYDLNQTERINQNSKLLTKQGPQTNHPGTLKKINKYWFETYLHVYGKFCSALKQPLRKTQINEKFWLGKKTKEALVPALNQTRGQN